MPRPYCVVGYSWVPALFVVAMAGLVVNTLYERRVIRYSVWDWWRSAFHSFDGDGCLLGA